MNAMTTGDFDAEVWDELLQLFGREGVSEMIAAVRDDLPQQRQRLGAALAAQDRRGVKAVAHSLRGVALQLGARGMAGDWSGIEAAIAAEHPLDGIVADAVKLLDRKAALMLVLQEKLHE